MENDRGRKRLGSVARFSLAGCIPGRKSNWREKKMLMLSLSLLYLFSHFSPSSLFRLYFIPLCTRPSLLFSFFPKVSHFRVCPFIFITLTFLTRWFFPFSFRTWAVILIFLFLCVSCFPTSWSFTSPHLYYFLSFILVYCLTLYFSIPAFCLLISLSPF